MTSPVTAPAKSGRNSAVELVRILSMLLVVISHCSVHGGFPRDGSGYWLNDYLLDWMVIGNLGVDMFLIITGYFLCTQSRKKEGFFRLLTQVWFYSLLCFGIACLAGREFSCEELWTVFFPTLKEEYWFFSAYVVLYLLLPYLNLFVKSATRTQHLTCLGVMLVLWSAIPTLFEQELFGYEMPQFVMLYLLGAYLRKYPDNLLGRPAVRITLTVVSYLLIFASSTVLRLFNQHFFWFRDPLSCLSRNALPVMGAAVGTFAIAIFAKPWVNSHINRLGGATFGVYLLHDNPFIRSMLWEEWIGNQHFYHSRMLVVRMGFSILAVYLAGTAVELLRQKTVAQPMCRFACRIFDTGKAYLSRILHRR